MIVHKIGRRKTSVARIYIKQGNGDFKINGRIGTDYFTTPSAKYKLKQAFSLTETINLYDVRIDVSGGGITGQVEAIRLAISRALVEINKENKTILKANKLLTRDPRMVERKKFGQKKSRKKFQFSKR